MTEEKELKITGLDAIVEKSVQAIILSKSEENYHIDIQYEDYTTELDMPKKRQHLKGFIAGFLYGIDDPDFWDIPVQNLQYETEYREPLDEKEFEDVSSYINAWVLSGLHDD